MRMSITLTRSQMRAIGKLADGLTEPHDAPGDRWTVEELSDGDLRLRDVESDHYIPGNCQEPNQRSAPTC